MSQQEEFSDNKGTGLSAEESIILEKLLKGQLPGELRLDKIPRRQVYSPVPLSFAQQRLWVLDRLVPGNPFYNLPTAMLLRGDLDIEIFERSINEIIRRHESLRTIFTMDIEREEPVQVILPELQIKVQTTDLRDLPPSPQEKEVRRLINEEAGKPFDLEQGPLVRVVLLTLAAGRYALVLTLHHIIADGGSVGVFIREVGVLYTAFSKGSPSPLPEPSLQYADFALWQRQRLQGDILEKQLAYWRELLSGNLPLLELPVDRQRPAVPTYRGDYQDIDLPGPMTAALNRLNRKEECSMFMTLLAALGVLLYRYSGQEDILVGFPIANRNRPEFEPMIGFFANTLVFRIDLSRNPTFRELLPRVRKVTSGAHDNQDLPFEKLVEEFQPDRYMSHTPFFQVMLHYGKEISKNKENHSSNGISFSDFPVHNKTSKFDIWIAMTQSGDNLRGGIEYNTDIFENATITRLIKNFKVLLSGITSDPDRHINDLPLLAEEDRTQLLVQWNDTRREYEIQCLHHSFAVQVEKTPDQVALVGQTQNEYRTYRTYMTYISYQQLEENSNQLACCLKEKGIQADIIVGIMAERSVEMVIGLLGILKAGGAYLPLDPDYPIERINYMLTDARVKVLVKNSNIFNHCDIENDIHIIYIDEVIDKNPPKGTASHQHLSPWLNIPVTSLAYVIYTSGSTGRPKGVMIPHEGISNRLQWMQEAYCLNSGDRILQKTPYSFDVSVWEFFWPLLTGAVLVMAKPGGHKDSMYLVEVIEKEKITTIHFVPTMLNAFLEDPGLWRVGSLKRVICSGEALPLEYRERFFANFRGVELHNLYGPTEASVDVTAWECKPHTVLHTIPIGGPIANTQIYILDRHLNPVPIGVHGELHIGGIQLARGYLNKPELTFEKFINFNTSYMSHMSYIYKTGDLVRWLPDGAIEFLGRLDFQVKVRGFRIELEEIESQLRKHPFLADAVVLARESQGSAADKKLVGYVIPHRDYLRSCGERESQKQDKDWRERQVADWEKVFDDTYIRDAALQDPFFNIIGWNSSYTGESIPAAEMQQWVDYTVERLLSLKPAKVLEIGCGTGLLLFRIIPYCESYTGTDISQKGLDYIRRQLDLLRSKADSNRVTLMHRAADDFQAMPARGFDLVILNSVVQYFPSVEYLLKVLQGAVEVVKPGGAIFIGDVRSLPLLETFHASVELYRLQTDESGKRNPGNISRDQFNQRVANRIYQEKELVIDPGFFMELGRHFPHIKESCVHLKRGRSRNELTKFRYDVILHIQAEGNRDYPTVDITYLDWQKDDLTLSSLRRLLAEQEPGDLDITHVPDARLAEDSRLMKWLKQEHIETLGQFLAPSADKQETGVDPEDFRSLREEFPYDIDVILSEPSFDSESYGQGGLYDVVLRHRSKSARPGVCPGNGFYSGTRPGPQPWDSYANNPLLAKISAELVPELRDFLKEKLPEYMVPSYFILMEQFPLTTNGKLNRQALPSLAASRGTSEKEDQPVKPCTEAEKFLVETWQDVLALDEVGIHDNFFKLGGDSVNAIQVIARINKKGFNLSLQNLYQNLTVAELAICLEKHQPPVQREELPGGDIKGEFDAFLAKIDTGKLSRLLPPGEEIENIYPLTPFQQHMLLHYLHDPLKENEPGVFITQVVMQMYLDDQHISIIDDAFQKLTDSYPYLRTAFVWEEVEEPVQIVYKNVSNGIRYHDWRHLSAGDRQKQLDSYIEADQNLVFERDKPIVYRIAVIRLEETDCRVILTSDYMRVDGWSTIIVLNNFMAYCWAIGSGQTLEIEVDNSYKNYLTWLGTQDQTRGENFWRQMLTGEREGDKTPVTIPTPLAARIPGNPRSSRQDKGFVARKIYLSRQETARLDAFLKQHQLVLSTAAWAVWSLLLSHYCSEQKVIFGVLVSGRASALEFVESMVGQALNVLPVQVNVALEKPVLEWLKDIWTVQVELSRYEYTSQEKIRQWWQIPPETPLFESYLVIQNFPGINKGRQGDEDLGAEPAKPFIEYIAQMEYPLRVELYPGIELGLILHYYQRCFSKESIEKIFKDFYTLLEEIVENPGQKVREWLHVLKRKKNE